MLSSAIIIESGNFWWSIVAFIGWAACMKIKFSKGLHTDAKNLINSTAWVMLGGFINHGWFAISRHLSGAGESWHFAMYEWRWGLILGTAAMFAWGATGLIQCIFRIDCKTRYMIMFISGLFALMVGVA